ncbi:hypothetical protein CONLIGDRAFT_637699 [Coniochaeta ligniaria NRRL 30616]|uniref:Uncharacterized protein n=1 Tax=Coniochaeta ligniaria NRRL 30616 TaxID=1408157 RepID=A0A1J7J024_9PEZI|nr:hypothetical protein CONLIGDRAFT_637699 [Coniochaeta ligniaria NRRL 30616]
MASHRSSTGHLALDAVLALQEAASFRAFPNPDGEDAHRGQRLSLQQVMDLLPVESRGTVHLEFGFGNLHNVNPLPLELFRKLTDGNRIGAFTPVSPTVPEPLASLFAAEESLLTCHASDFNACSSLALEHACLRKHVYDRVPIVLIDPVEADEPELFALRQGNEPPYGSHRSCLWRCTDILTAPPRPGALGSSKPSDVLAAVIVTVPCLTGCPGGVRFTPGIGLESPAWAIDAADEDEYLYPGELAAISRLMAHQLRYDKLLADATGGQVTEMSAPFLITGDITAIVFNFTIAGVRVLMASLLYESWTAPPQVDEPQRPKIVLRCLEEIHLDDALLNTKVRRWLLFLTTYKSPITPATGGHQALEQSASSHDSGYSSVGENDVCGMDCKGC